MYEQLGIFAVNTQVKFDFLCNDAFIFFIDIWTTKCFYDSKCLKNNILGKSYIFFTCILQNTVVTNQYTLHVDSKKSEKSDVIILNL